jgi:hypothetical protein
MSEKESNQSWKMVVGGIIIAIAFAIMLPGVFDYLGRIGKVIIVLVVALVLAFVVVLVRHKLTASKRG